MSLSMYILLLFRLRKNFHSIYYFDVCLLSGIYYVGYKWLNSMVKFICIINSPNIMTKSQKGRMIEEKV